MSSSLYRVGSPLPLFFQPRNSSEKNWVDNAGTYQCNGAVASTESRADDYNVAENCSTTINEGKILLFPGRLIPLFNTAG